MTTLQTCMIKRLFFIVFSAFMAGSVIAQEAVGSVDPRPQRTPEEEALKQTTRLVRELGIKDSVRIDTLYKMHLKYARFRQKGLSRGENMERMQAIYNELKQLLTAEEFERFMNHPAEQPRRPRGASGLKQTKQAPPTTPQTEAQP